MDLELKNKRAVILASSTGLGFGIAKKLAEEGAQVVITSSNEEHIKSAAKKIPQSIPFVCDLNKKGEGKTLIQKAISALGGIDILITNTGGPEKGMFSDLSLESWEKGFQQVFLSAVETMHEAIPLMKHQKWGRILLSLSTSVKQPIPKLNISTGFRSGLLGLMKSISLEVAQDGITVNAILPGFTKTSRLSAFSPEEKLIEDIPMKRLGTIEEFSALAAFLVSQSASYITGQAIACDGGLIRGI